MQMAPLSLPHSQTCSYALLSFRPRSVVRLSSLFYGPAVVYVFLQSSREVVAECRVRIRPLYLRRGVCREVHQKDFEENLQREFSLFVKIVGMAEKFV